MSTLPPCDFLQLQATAFDVRSPAEYARGHIPGAVNLPLFSDEERAAVGTAYKQQGQKAAISLGLEITGPKLARFVAEASAKVTGNSCKVYCWRGGMRSEAIAWLLGFGGMSVATLQKGYKAYRHWLHELIARPREIIVIGGMTGSGKTAILNALKQQGETVLDLESLANHRGSAFGKVGIAAPQPSTEHFENLIAAELEKADPASRLWIEDESRLVGTCLIPDPLFTQMRNAPMVVIEPPIAERVARLIDEYCSAPIQQLFDAVRTIGRRLGGNRLKMALEALESGRMDEALHVILEYYDSAYAYSLNKRHQAMRYLRGEKWTPEEWAERIK